MRFEPLAEEVEGVGEGALTADDEFALRKDMVVVVVVVEVEDAVGVAVAWSRMPAVGSRVCSV